MKAVLAVLYAWKVAVAVEYPLYLQCDPMWADDIMGLKSVDGSQDTICAEGCAITALAMGLAGHNQSIAGSTGIVTPSSLNDALVANNFYYCADGDCCNLKLNATDLLTGSRWRTIGEWGGDCCGGDAAKPTAAVVNASLETHIYIAHVRSSSHFVLITGFHDDGMTISVRDPYYDVTTYNYESDVSDLLIFAVIPPYAQVPFGYPLQKQSDYQWGQDFMVNKTISQVGCLMSSTSMMLAANSILVNDLASTPGTLNAWLRANDGYSGDSNLKESSIPIIDPTKLGWDPLYSMHTQADLDLSTIHNLLHQKQPIIANVDNGRHFVLVLGYDPNDSDILYVNDPGFFRASYSFHQDVVGWRLYNVSSSFQLSSLSSSVESEEIEEKTMIVTTSSQLISNLVATFFPSSLFMPWRTFLLKYFLI